VKFSRRLFSLLQLPWLSQELVTRHRRLFGTLGIFVGGAAFGGGLALMGGVPDWAVFLIVASGALAAVEGITLAFARPPRPLLPAAPSGPPPPPGAVGQR